MSGEPHFGRTRTGHAVHLRTEDHHPAETGYERFNKRLALWLTRNVGTMTCFWAFTVLAGLSLPATLVLMGWVPKTIPYVPAFVLGYGWIYLIQWIAQSYFQLVLLPALMVGQNLQNAAADARAAKTFEDVELLLDRLDTATPGGLADVMAAVARVSGGPGGNPGAAGLTADKRVVPPPAAPPDRNTPSPGTRT